MFVWNFRNLETSTLNVVYRSQRLSTIKEFVLSFFRHSKKSPLLLSFTFLYSKVYLHLFRFFVISQTYDLCTLLYLKSKNTVSSYYILRVIVTNRGWKQVQNEIETSKRINNFRTLRDIYGLIRCPYKHYYINSM